MGKQGTQNPHLTEFILACVEHKDNICIIANWICELQLKHFHKSVKKTEKKQSLGLKILTTQCEFTGHWQVGGFFVRSVSILFGDLWLGIDSSRDNMYPRHNVRIFVTFVLYNWYLWATVPGVVIKGETANLLFVQMKLQNN